MALTGDDHGTAVAGVIGADLERDRRGRRGVRGRDRRLSDRLRGGRQRHAGRQRLQGRERARYREQLVGLHQRVRGQFRQGRIRAGEAGARGGGRDRARRPRHGLRLRGRQRPGDGRRRELPQPPELALRHHRRGARQRRQGRELQHPRRGPARLGARRQHRDHRPSRHGRLFERRHRHRERDLVRGAGGVRRRRAHARGECRARLPRRPGDPRLLGAPGRRDERALDGQRRRQLERRRDAFQQRLRLRARRRPRGRAVGRDVAIPLGARQPGDRLRGNRDHPGHSDGTAEGCRNRSPWRPD